MPVHDWTRVDAGTFHDFHSSWIIHLKETFNEGLLPEGYYALAEQHAGQTIADVLTLHVPESESFSPPSAGAVAVAEVPPRVSRSLVASPLAHGTRRTLTIRHVSGHRIVALVEIVSPANKDRGDSVQQFVQKVFSALEHRCHVLVVDLLPCGRHDPNGISSAIRDLYNAEENDWPNDKPFTLASFVAANPVKAHVEKVDVGEELPDMPLFLTADYYISVPLEETYQEAYRGVPAYWRGVIESL